MEVEVRSSVISHDGCAAQGPRALGSAAATVPVFIQDTEAPVLGQQQWEAVHERRAAGYNLSAIARDLQLDRKTVRSCLQQESWQPYQRAAAASLLDPHRAWLAERAVEVNYSARILWQELRAQRGFAGSYVIVRRAVVPLRLAASTAALTQRRFETGPGEQAQCDWGQITVSLGGVRTEVHIFVMTLGYSRRGFALGFLRERMPDLLAAHEAAFAHFGGRCEFLLYDRMRTVVLGTHQGRPRLNPTFSSFAGHWGFTPRLCQPYRAQTKGKVESGVKYVKRNFVPGRTFLDLEDFNDQLAAWQTDVADVRIHGTTHQRPIDRFAEEARALTPTAGHPSFLQAMVRERRVAEDWLVSIDGNRYSVPFVLIGKSVQVVRQGGAWVIRHLGAVVAEHPVLAGRGQLSVQPAHGPGAVARNARQRFSAPRTALTTSRPQDLSRDVEVRDPAIYEQLFAAPLVEAAT
ncbi:IS21 family transposase [Variovorax ginsengisoli]|uniref:IS21 family transposase n=1 Tax=Variovorax ginsengisoli TaxID=363844 RepID=A0ABT8SKL8_9BURK|nr:IS21 family transposase [Variovorax ginsengisoli]MDN8618961.1 IS21 family transposase [Variovorax ginsengisoli]MDO1538131.1 IS21 family transposase [Variovorax ginsengisoli]